MPWQATAWASRWPPGGCCETAGRIGRLATVQALRGSGIGRAVLEALLNAARERGDEHVELHAQPSARAFYEHAGFEATGETFEQAGIAHVTLARRP